MKFPTPHTLLQIAKLINCQFVGDDNFPVLGINEIHVVESGDIVFVDHPKYYNKALNSAATIILINKEVDCPEGKALLISDDPFRDFNKLTNHFKPFQHSNQAISDSAIIGKNTIIQPNCFIGNNVVIGDDCVIHSNVSIYDDTIIGNNVTIHRGVTADTRICEGTKIDNQVQIGHDTVIGKKCLIASQVGIAGCVIIEDEVTIWGQVGMTSGITIGKKAVIQAQSGISKSLQGGKTYFGYPAEEVRVKLKELAAIRQIPQIVEALKSKK